MNAVAVAPTQALPSNRLQDKPQRGRPRALTPAQTAHLVAIACTPAPEGHDHWTVRLLAGKVVELGFVHSISPETIRQALIKARTPSTSAWYRTTPNHSWQRYRLGRA